MTRLTILLSALMFAIASFGATVRPMTVEELTESATSIVEGQAVEVWSAWDTQHREILTYTRFNVSKSLKGTAAKQVVVTQLGGKVGTLTIKASGVRHFQVGENALLFLRPGETSDTMALAALQGNFHLAKDGTGDTVASNGMPDTFVLTGSKVTPYAGKTISLGVLETSIRKAVTR